MHSQLIRVDVPLMIAASLLTWLLALDGKVGRLDGSLLFGMLLAYVWWSVRQARHESQFVRDEFAAEYGGAPTVDAAALTRQGGLTVAGLLALSLASRWLVGGCVSIAQLLGVSELVIGLTVVAVGTSLPELMTSIVASVRGERDIAVGNIVGSNLFNLLAVLGLSGLIATDGITVSLAARRFDIPVMVTVSIACLPICLSGRQIARWEGVLFLGYYGFYVIYLVLGAVQVVLPDPQTVVVLAFALPLTLITLCVGLTHKLRRQRADVGA